MQQNSSINLSYSPGVQCLLPILYTAWADRVLTPSEIRALREKAAELNFLKEEEKEVLLQWSRPDRPPSPTLFKYWEIELQRAARQLPEKDTYSLAELGMAMAQQADEQDADWSSPEIKQQLETLETGLGRVDIDTRRHLFAQAQPEPARPEPNATARAIQNILEHPHQEIRERLRLLLLDPAFSYQHFTDKAAYRDRVMHWLQLLAEQGLGALAYPFAQGGQKDMGAYATVFEMLGHHDLSLAIKFGVQFGLFGGSIHQLGNRRQHEQYLEAVGQGQLLGGFAMTETAHGSDVRSLETTLTYDPATDELVVHSPRREAGKEYIGNALYAHMLTVFGQLIVKGENHGVHAVLLPIRDKEGKLFPGIRVEDCGDKLGLNGVDNGRIWFHEVRVPRENLLDRFGSIDEAGNYQSPIESPARRFFTMLSTLVGGRVCVPRAGLSAAKSGITIAVRYALRRRQFSPRPGEPETLLLDYPSHQRRLMPLLAKAYACHFGLMKLSRQFVASQEGERRETETLAAGLKAYATWFTTAALQECREACGGKGYLSENRFAALKADTDVFTTFEGDNTVLMQLVAKGLLTAFKKEFNEEGNWAVLRHLRQRIGTVLTEQNPFALRNTSRSHLLSEDFHLSAFRFRENRLLLSLAQRIRGLVKEGYSAYEAGLRCQPHMINLGEAFAERVVLEAFVQRLKTVKNQAAGDALRTLCQLYALHTIERHKGWYLEKDYMAGVKTKAIRSEVDRLCALARRDADTLVDAFAIPDELLGAAILRPTAARRSLESVENPKQI